MNPEWSFSGSYDTEDVVFLMQPVHLELTDVAVKERMIQSGARHYSELLGPEHPPSHDYLHAYFRALESNGRRLALFIQ